jgi:site-specific recombinase XerD
MRASEICALRLCDVNRELRELLVRGKGAQERRFTLGHEGWRHLRTYLDDYRPRNPAGEEQAESSSEYLFLSERGRPLTKNGIMHVFERLRNRASMTGKQVTASLLRKNFAARYLQAGGDWDSLQELLGQQGRLSWQQHSLEGTK